MKKERRYLDKSLKWYLATLLFLFGVFLQTDAFAFTFTLNVADGSGNPVNGFGYLVQQDDTNQPPLPLGTQSATTLSVSIHKTAAPVETNGSSTSSSAMITVPDGRRYFVTVLPTASVPFGYSVGGAIVENGQTSVTVTVQRNPILTAQISVLAFHDNKPINNAPDFGFEDGLSNFSVLIFDQLGQMSQDAFANPLGTTYVQNPDGTFQFNPDGTPVVATRGGGVIKTDADGRATIKYIAPGKYGVRVVPPAGSGWIQTNTIEGTPGIDAWVKAGEPQLLVEFGPPFPHVFYGFVKEMDLLNTLPVPPGGSKGTVTGRVVKVHTSRPPLILQIFPGNPVSECYVGLNTLSGGAQAGVYVAACNADGTFTINNVPPGNYQLVMWDKPLDVIFAFATLIVPPAGGTVAMGDIPVNMWFGTLKGTVFEDTNGNGVRDPGEPGIHSQVINLRFRDGSIYLSTFTDPNGDYEFAEVFPFFKFLIVEVDFARLRATGATIVVDNGGPLGQLPIYPFETVNTPQPQPENGNQGWRVETAPEPVLLEAQMLFADQTNVINFGKKPYSSGTNGGIAGVVYYATTRAEEDPRLAAADPWEPGIPGVTINLYEDFDRDGIPDGPAIDSVSTDSWDDLLPSGCVGPTQYVMVNGVSTPVTNCAENLQTWNQVRPAVFDGGYLFYNLPAGTYIVETIPPTGYEVAKEEDKNVDFGEQYTPSPLVLPPVCVGPDHIVPDYLSLFPDQQIPAPFAGQTRPLCTRKQITVIEGLNAAADFHLFTVVPKAARAVGIITNDLGIEGDPRTPIFSEKQGPSWIPISFQNSVGKEIVRVYSDEFGAYNALLPSSYTVNPPIPTGVSPNMITVCLNHPFMPDPLNPGQVIPDPQFDPRFSLTCYNLDFWPGKTTYLDTPVIPVSAQTGATNTKLDCESSDGVPGIFSVSGPTGGPYVSVANGTESITIVSRGTAVPVPNPNFAPFSGIPQTVNRDFGFGAIQGTGSVTVGGVLLTVTNWTATSITAAVPNGVSTGQLVVTRGDNGKFSEVGVTLHVGNAGNPVIHVPGDYSTIQAAIDAPTTTPGSLILVGPAPGSGAYDYVFMYKNVKLQGWGAYSAKINASPFPAEKLTAWRNKLALLIANGDIDLIPGQDPTFANEEGPGILVATKNAVFGSNPHALIDGFGISGATLGGGIYVNGYARYLAISNNVISNNLGTFGGGIRIGTPSLPAASGYQSSFNDHISIYHNQISLNGSGGLLGAGGVSVFNGSDFYTLTETLVCGNFTTQNGAGFLHFGLSDQGQIVENRFLFNEASFGSVTGGNGGAIYISGESAPAGAPGNVTPGTGSVTLDANLIQGNVAGNGKGGGIFTSFVNGRDVFVSPNNSAGWYSFNMFNNIIVNNVAGFAGAVTLTDTAKANIIHNTISNNDSTGTGANSFVGGVNPACVGAPPNTCSDPQGAGIVSTLHSANLSSAIGTGGGPEFNKNFSNPVLYNNIIRDNRSFYFNAAQAGNVMGGLVPNIPPQWDLQVFGSAVFTLNPQYSILTDATGYAPTNLGGPANDPAFVTPYFNQLAAFSAPQEGGNSIQVVYTPLTLTGNYHITMGSPARDQGFSIANPPLSQFAQLALDFDGNTRPGGGGPDMGADEATALGPTVNITATADANGSISPTGTVNVLVGGNQTFVITPNPGFKILDVTVNGSSVGPVALYTFINVQAAQTIAASFAVSTFTITSTSTTVGGGTGGSITPAGAVIVGNGATQAFSIAVNAGYHLVDVLVDGGSVGPVGNYTFSNVIINHTIEAIFASDTGAFTIAASAGAGGTVTPPGATAYNLGANAVYTITPNTGYQIVDVLVDDVSVLGSLVPGAGRSMTYTFNNLQANHVISASFVFVSDIFVLIESYYNNILDRAPEPGGAESWTAEINRIVSLGIDIKEGFIAVGKSFFNSAEYLAMGKTDAAYITDLYQAFLNRTPSQTEVDFWVGYLTGGASRNIVLNFFVFSPEFNAYMTGVFGVSAARPENNLVNDFYRGILSRLPDTTGFNFWLGLMRAAQCAGSAQQIRDLSYQIASSFVGSAEYVARARTNSQYVEDLYDAIMRRGADPTEVNYWVGVLNGATMTRDQVLQFFTDSTEFQTRVQAVIDAGCLP